MTTHAPAIPSWRAWVLRLVIYAAICGLLALWNVWIALMVAVLNAIDLIHHAADTARRRNGYVPIPRHPAVSDQPPKRLERKGRPILIAFVLCWAVAMIAGRAITGAGWLESAGQALAVAMGIAIAGALFFPLLAMGLLWIMSITLGLALSIADLLALVFSRGDRRNDWHRAVDAFDHRLADATLGQDAAIPLRADMAERAAMQAKDAK